MKTKLLILDTTLLTTAPTSRKSVIKGLKTNHKPCILLFQPKVKYSQNPTLAFYNNNPAPHGMCEHTALRKSHVVFALHSTTPNPMHVFVGHGTH